MYRTTTADFDVAADQLVDSTTVTTFVDQSRPAGTWYYRAVARR